MDQTTAARIRLLCLDVDGVLTDGRLFLDADGRETKCFHTQDGLAIRLWQSTGRHVAVITGRSSEPLRKRCEELGVSFLAESQENKQAAWENVLAHHRLTASEAAMVGDDLPDLPLIQMASLGIAVANAAEDVKQAADWITKRNGGDGAVREVVETLLHAAGEWDAIRSRYDADPVGR